MGRSQRNSTHNLRNKSPPVKKSKRKETLENLGINFGQPSTPNEKKGSNESNPERFIFLGKISRQNLSSQNLWNEMYRKCGGLDKHKIDNIADYSIRP